MDMDDQIIDLMRDQFKTLHEKIDNVSEVMQKHIEKDEKYWAKSDQHEGQLYLLKWLCGPGIAGFFTWLYNAIKH